MSEEKLVEGGLYVISRKVDGYQVVKILKLDEGGVHIRLYSNVYPQPPTNVDESVLYMAGMERKPDEEMGMGHLPISHASFAGWHARFVQQSTVSKEELEGYAMWKEANGGYF